MAAAAERTTQGALCVQVDQAPANMTRILFPVRTEKFVAVKFGARDARCKKIVITPTAL